MTFTEIHAALSAAIEAYPDMSSESYDDLSLALDLIDTWAGKLDSGFCGRMKWTWVNFL